MKNRNEIFLTFLGYKYTPENSSNEDMSIIRLPFWENKKMKNVNKNISLLPSDANINNWEFAMLIFNKLKLTIIEKNLNSSLLNDLNIILFTDNYFSVVDKTIDDKFIVKNNNNIVYSSFKKVELTDEQYLKLVNDKRLEDFLNEMCNILEIING